METVSYGNTGLQISRLCIGCGHLNNVYPNPEDAVPLLLACLDRGVNFWDTAEGYKTHPHVAAAFKRIDRSRVVLQTKTSAREYDDCRQRIDADLAELGTDYIDVMFLHGVNSPRDLNERSGALRALLEAKAAGKVRHVGCSTHIFTGPVMDAVTDCDDLEVILCVANKTGMMLEGSRVSADKDAPRVPETVDYAAHLEQIRRAYEKGKGISIMKIIAQRQAPEAEWPEWIRWGFEFPHAHAVNLGISRLPELELDVQIEAEVRAARQRRAA